MELVPRDGPPDPAVLAAEAAAQPKVGDIIICRSRRAVITEIRDYEPYEHGAVTDSPISELARAREYVTPVGSRWCAIDVNGNGWHPPTVVGHIDTEKELGAEVLPFRLRENEGIAFDGNG